MRLAFPGAVPLVAVIAAFFGLAAVAHAQPGSVAVFDNSDYVDNTSTDFSADGPTSLPQNNGTDAVDPTTLPPGAKVIYADPDGFAAVVDIPFGDGSITLLGWDWFDSSPPDPTLGPPPSLAPRGLQLRGDSSGGQDFGWQDVLRRSVDLPVLNVGDVSVTEGNSA